MSQQAAVGSPDAEQQVMALLARCFPGVQLRQQRAFTRAGMSPEELVRLYELVTASQSRRILEIGMASGTSTVVILSALEAVGGGQLTSIDPYQTASFEGRGLERVRASGLDAQHQLIEEPDYLALPKLLAERASFDFILVDGYHSFDYTLVDVFYADLLLRPGGLLAVHDSSWPAVFKVLRFVERYKDYERLSPPSFIRVDNILEKAVRRLAVYCSGPAAIRAFNQRRLRWHTLAAYKKRSDSIAPEFDARL